MTSRYSILIHKTPSLVISYIHYEIISFWNNLLLIHFPRGMSESNRLFTDDALSSKNNFIMNIILQGDLNQNYLTEITSLQCTQWDCCISVNRISVMSVFSEDSSSRMLFNWVSCKSRLFSLGNDYLRKISYYGNVSEDLIQMQHEIFPPRSLGGVISLSNRIKLVSLQNL